MKNNNYRSYNRFFLGDNSLNSCDYHLLEAFLSFNAILRIKVDSQTITLSTLKEIRDLRDAIDELYKEYDKAIEERHNDSV